MCGIVGAISNRNIVPVLISGLQRLEYRGYDSAGLAVIAEDGNLDRARAVGRVSALQELIVGRNMSGTIGIAHTRWATHGAPAENNAHPHISNDGIAIVHNGIIENHEQLREELLKEGYRFTSQTDTEVIAHRIHYHLKNELNLIKAVRKTVAELHGAYALAVIKEDQPDHIVLARMGCPVVIGVAEGENFVASDVSALLSVTRNFIFLEEGDVAEIGKNSILITDNKGMLVTRQVRQSALSAGAVEKGEFRHYMLKEIYEQPVAVAQTLGERVAGGKLLDAAFGPSALDVFKKTRAVKIVACGTSYHAGLVAKYWIEQICRVPCTVEIASEFRYRNPVVTDATLFVTISQSGETADTLAALRLAKEQGYLSQLAICNVPESSLVRESELSLLTRAGPEIGVASTKAFTTQLTALGLLVIALGKYHGFASEYEAYYVHRLLELPELLHRALSLDPIIAALARSFSNKHHALFLGRGPLAPISAEGALKLKEISYIHAEAYPAGELKHGPLALVDEDMPVVVVAPSNDLLQKLKANLQEVRARGGKLYVFADAEAQLEDSEGITVITMPRHASPFQEPILYTLPLQLLAYHVALIKGEDVDKPRNLAKSVTVE